MATDPRNRTLAATLVALLLLALACADGSMEELRRHTYPPDFNYIRQDQLESTMWRLAARVHRLDEIMREDESQISRAEVGALLADMERATRELGHAGWASNHPGMDAHLDRLKHDLQRAKLAVERDPPNYFWAGSVSGACTYCHAPRG